MSTKTKAAGQGPCKAWHDPEMGIEYRVPYHPAFPKRARNLGGVWRDPAWFFDPRDEQRVRALCLEIFGDDGASPVELVTARVSFAESWAGEEHQGLYMFGRKIAQAFSRDSGAKIGKQVVVTAGEGFNSGGSRAHWRTTVIAGTVFEVRDVPRRAVEQEVIPEDMRDRVKIEILDAPEESPRPLVLTFDVVRLNDSLTGAKGITEEITVTVASGNPGGGPGDFENFIQKALSQWFDGANIQLKEK